MPGCDRRIFLRSSVLCGLALTLGQARGQNVMTVPNAVHEARRVLPLEYELVRLACLAANSHNAQAWLFCAESGRISIRADLSRRCAQVDPRDHHLWVSIGCAIENVVQAAPGMGRIAKVAVVGGDQPEVIISLSEAANPAAAPLARFIPLRQSTRSDYDARAVPLSQLTKLVEAAAGGGVEARLVTDHAQRRSLEALILEANAIQVESTEFRRELKQWLRFNETDAKASGDGLFSACSGNPELPAWLANRLFDWFYTAASANETLARQLTSSSGFILLHSGRNDSRQWIDVGRSAQRLALQITALGMKMAFVNQALEVESFRPRLLSALNLSGRHPDLLIRYGYAQAMPSSFRRPPKAVLC
jgi:hypothetical protein